MARTQMNAHEPRRFFWLMKSLFGRKFLKKKHCRRIVRYTQEFELFFIVVFGCSIGFELYAIRASGFIKENREIGLRIMPVFFLQ